MITVSELNYTSISPSLSTYISTIMNHKSFTSYSSLQHLANVYISSRLE
uniref:Uncharacterized protein n=1 Tax=Anguilla anguilla TaxID=7936 RepID=A0A0E9SN14_ANGAN